MQARQRSVVGAGIGGLAISFSATRTNPPFCVESVGFRSKTLAAQVCAFWASAAPKEIPTDRRRPQRTGTGPSHAQGSLHATARTSLGTMAADHLFSFRRRNQDPAEEIINQVSAAN